MKKKTTSIIEEQLQRLNRSPLFAISLSGKELSHSNFWAWLLEQKVEGKHPFIEVFIPNFYQNGCTFISVEREKKHVDLTITYKNKANETEVLIIENKIKSIPTKEQLIRYEEELGKKLNNHGNSNRIIRLIRYSKSRKMVILKLPRNC